jgi:SAM-dependent methyltransferase
MTARDQDDPHSSAYFGQQRDYWWNADYLELLARRWQLGTVETVLDVGAGVGHWAGLVASILAPRAKVIGVERDPRSVERAQQRAREHGLADRLAYLVGVAEKLPFDDGTFDLVTCQTLLIHVPDVMAVIGEMRRVTKPGGLIVLAEPNNAASMMVATSRDLGEPLGAKVERLEFVLRCERGKIALGEGDNSIGDLLPGFLSDAGLVDVEAFLNDKTFALVAPYDSDAQRALCVELREDVEQRRWLGWSRAEARRFYLAGGGNEADVDQLWQQRLNETDEAVRQLEAGQLHTGGGSIEYIIHARRPS